MEKGKHKIPPPPDLRMVIGNRDCKNCTSLPTHQLLSCKHTVCAIHVRQAAEIFEIGAPKCAVCNSIVTGLGAAPLVGSLSPAAYHAHSPKSNPVSSPGSAGRPGFTPQTPVPGRTFHRRNTTSYGASPPDIPRGYHYSPSTGSPDRTLSLGTHSTRPNWLNLDSVPEDPFYQSPPSSSDGRYTQTRPGAQSPAGLAARIKSRSGRASVSPASSRGASPSPAGSGRRRGRFSFGAAAGDPPIRHWDSHLDEVVQDPPFMLAATHGDGRLPGIEEAVSHVPLTNPAIHLKVADNGVIKIINIPFECTKQEILAAIGRNARVVHQPQGTPFYAIHIIMDRNTGKTNEAFVEVDSKEAAEDVMSHYHDRRQRGRAPKIGDRHVIIELSDMPTLMAKLFPKAISLQWWGSIPVPFKPADGFTTGFRGFITIEECSQLTKHAEEPKRSPFISRSSNRVYEAVISIVHKYPWYKPELITVGERAILFKAAKSMVRLLIKGLVSGTDSTLITPLLLQELVCAIVTVNFSHSQKYEVVQFVCKAGFTEIIHNVGYTPVGECTAYWPFLVLDKKKGVKVEVVQFYASLFHKASILANDAMLTEEQAAAVSVNPFGALTVPYPDNVKELDLVSVAALDWDTVVRSLQRVLKKSQLPDITDTTSSSSVVRHAPTSRSTSAVKDTDPIKLSEYAMPSIASIAGLGAPGFASPGLHTPSAGGVPLPPAIGGKIKAQLPSPATSHKHDPVFEDDSMADPFMPLNYGSDQSKMWDNNFTGPGYDAQGNLIYSRPNVVSANNKRWEGVISDLPKRRSTTSHWQNKRSGLILPPGMKLSVQDETKDVNDSEASPPRRQFDPTPGGHLRSGFSPSPPRYSREGASPPTYESAVGFFPPLPGPPPTQPLPTVPAADNHVPTACIDIVRPKVSTETRAIPDDMIIGKPRPNSCMPPTPAEAKKSQKSPILERFTDAFPDLGAKPLFAVFSKGKSKATADKEIPEGGMFPMSPGPSTYSTARKGGELNPDAASFTSPTAETSTGQAGKAGRPAPTFAEICGRAGIKLGKAEEKGEKGKGKNPSST
ncbi:hypothetical protein KVT40_003150 [Elsinoe batatas]|uniref:RRM domain-containing protein n=1 Tax=Elsinoe batatas TaxID=2601811 RepID=A0A8K0L5I6_9PEZI|nr:hypothetical protein KVT40_003150 [Elsinoe batatas]